MAVIGWKEVYETGIVELDNEHRELVDGVNQLYESIRDKRSDEVLDEVLALLEKYTCDHFEHEEKIMETYAFPDLEQHKGLHRELIESLQLIKDEPIEKVEVAKKLLAFLRKWILNHIIEVDKSYGPFLESRAGRFVSWTD